MQEAQLLLRREGADDDDGAKRDVGGRRTRDAIEGGRAQSARAVGTKKKNVRGGGEHTDTKEDIPPHCTPRPLPPEPQSAA
jgi:hypothetical protein